jgi:hypothetical protein
MRIVMPAMAAVGALALLGAAQARQPGAVQAPNTTDPRKDARGQGTAMDGVSEGYVKLVLAMGGHDPDYVDAYYGPPAWKDEAAAAKLGLDAIATRGTTLLADLRKIPAGTDEMSSLRHQYLERQLSALAARVRMLKGERLTFDEESKALYDAVAPTYPEAHFQ